MPGTNNRCLTKMNFENAKLKALYIGVMPHDCNQTLNSRLYSDCFIRKKLSYWLIWI